MAERLSARLSDMLVEFVSEAALVHQERCINELEILDFANQAKQEVDSAHKALEAEFHRVTDEEKEKNLQRANFLNYQLSRIAGMKNSLTMAFPEDRVNFDNVSLPWRVDDLTKFSDHLYHVIGKIKDTTLSGGLKKLVGYNGWKSNNEAAGELWLQLYEVEKRTKKEKDALLPQFDRFCKDQAVHMRVEQEKATTRLKKKLDAKSMENKAVKDDFERRLQKLMGDPRIAKIEKELRLVGPMVGKEEGWLHYTPATQVPPELLLARCLGRTADLQAYNWHPASGIKAGDFLDPYARQFSFYNPKVQGFVIPETFLVDYQLLLWAETDGDVSGPAGLMRDVVLRQLRFMPLKSTRSFFIDPKGLGHSMRDLIKLTQEQGGCGVCSLATQTDQITQTMAALRQFVTQVRQTLTVSGAVDTTVYNARPDVKQKIPYTTLVVHDFPCGFTAQAVEDLRTVIEQANECGFTIMVSRSKNDPMDDKAKDLFYNSEKGRRLEYRGDKCVLHDGDLHLPLRRMEVEASQDFLREYNERYSYKPPVKNGFFDHMTDEALARPYRDSSAKEVRFPFAVDGRGQVQELVLDSDLKSYGLIIGGTGAGKTSLLHTIINSAALHYSPKELELWLIDYKLTSFDFYKRNRLPHVRHIVMDETDVLTYSVVDELRIEYARRQRLFKKAGAKDFADYRDKGNELARLLVLVDETHLMSQALADDPDYKQHMHNIIAQARYTGINILFADQKYSALGGLAGCMSDMYVRISLKNDMEQVKDTLGVYNLSAVGEEIAATIQSMPAAAAGTMIYKHEERNPDDPKTKLVRYDHISCLYAETDAFVPAIRAVQAKAGAGDWPCEVYEGPARLTYDEQAIADYELRDPMRLGEGDRFYIGSPRGMGRCFHFSLKPEDEGENILLVGAQNELRAPLVANTIRNALRHGCRVEVLVPRASMFYKKNKEFVQSLADEFDRQVTFHTEYADICRYIGLKANLLRSLDEDGCDDIPESEPTLVICLGTDDLYKKMDDDPNTQATAWAGLDGVTAVQEEKKAESQELTGGFDWAGLTGSIESMLDELEAEEKPAPDGFDDAIGQLQALLGQQPGSEDTPTAPAAPTAGGGAALKGYNTTGDLYVLIRDGWKLSMHTMLTVNSANGLKNMSRIKLSGNFNHRLALPMAPEQGSAFLYYTKALKAMADEGDLLGAVYEYMGGNGQRFIPYL